MRTLFARVACLLAVATGLGTMALPPAAAQTLDHSAGFAAHSDLLVNGSATFPGDRLRLTDVQGGVSNVYTAFPVNVSRFYTRFRFQMTNAGADGMTFIVQASSPYALGNGGGGLGSMDIPRSVAIKFDIYPNDYVDDQWGEFQIEASDSMTGVFVNGEVPFGGDDLAPYGMFLRSGHVFEAQITYGKGVLWLEIKDTQTGYLFTKKYNVNIPSIVGGNNAYIGFTAATGGFTATQDILSWQFRAPSPVFTNYTVTQVPTPFFSSNNYLARSINNHGNVVGDYQGINGIKSFLYNGSTTQPLNRPELEFAGGYRSWATEINPYDYVVGASEQENANDDAFLYSAAGGMNTLPSPGNTSIAMGMNSGGTLVGLSTDRFGESVYSVFRGFETYAMRWNGASATRFAVPFGDIYSTAFDINNNGTSVGWSAPSINERFAVLWDAAGNPSYLPIAYYSELWRINDFDELAGIFYPNGFGRTGVYLFRRLEADGNSVSSLHTYNYSSTYPGDLNNLGEIVGAQDSNFDRWDYPIGIYSQGTRATLWAGGTYADLNSRIPAGTGWTLRHATDINDLGEICGYGTFNSRTLSYVLRPAYPGPSISSLSPAAAQVGSGSTAVYVGGANLSPTSVVLWNGSPLPTFFGNASLLLTVVPAANLTQVGTFPIQVVTPAPGGGASNVLNFTVSGFSVSGRVLFQDSAVLSQTLTFTFRPSGGAAFDRTVTTNGSGDYVVTNIPPGTYQVRIKGAKWLAQVVGMAITNASVTGVNATLPGGDANNDNSADALDLAVLITAFNTELGQPGYDVTADFNDDGACDALDLAILITNFNQDGAQ